MNADASAAPSAAESQRQTRFREVARVLERAAREQPVLLALDDLQLADRDSIALLRFVAPSLASARVWVLASHREVAPPDGRAGDLAALAAESATRVLHLRGLGAEEVQSLVGNELAAPVGAELSRVLARLTSGNPLFALEIARSLPDGSRSLEHALQPEEQIKLAHGIGPLLARKLAALAPREQALLRSASAIGEEFALEILKAAEGCSDRALARALADGERAGLLAAGAGPRRRFVHALFADALYAELAGTPGALAQQHLRIGAALERLGVTDPFLLASHFTRARPVAGAAAVLPHAREAAREAARRFALADAEYWCRQVVALAEEAGEPLEELYELLLLRGGAALAAFGIDAARESFERAARIAVELGDARRLALAAVSHAHRPFPFGSNPGVLRWLRLALASPCEDAGLRARVASRLGSELVHEGPEQAERARALVAEGAAVARSLGDPAVLGPVLLDLSAALPSACDPRDRIALAEEIESNGRRARDYDLELRGLHARATGHLELGERGGAEVVLSAYRSLEREHALPYARSVLLGMEVMFAVIDGRVADARVLIEESARDVRNSGSVGLAAVVVIQRFTLVREDGDFAAVLPALAQLRARFPAMPGLAALLGLAHALAGDLAAARRELHGVIPRLPHLPDDRHRLLPFVLAAEIAYRVGASDAVGLLEPELAPYRALHGVLGNAAGYFGSVSQALGWCAAARGRTAEAVEHFQRALRAHEALRSPTWAKRSAEAIAAVQRGSLRVIP